LSFCTNQALAVAGKGGNTRMGLARQSELEMMQQQRDVVCRFGVARHGQVAPIGGRERDVQHLNTGGLIQHRPRRQSRSVSLPAMLQGYAQTVRQKRHQNVRFDAMLELMINRADAKLALQTFKEPLRSA